jgi:uncharacterized protein YjaZ
MKNKIHINFFFPKKSKIIKLDNFIERIINEIKDKNLINYSGYINNEELYENLLINIGDKNIENYKNISLFRKHKINKYIIEAIKKCNKKIIIPNDLFIFVFPWFPTKEENDNFNGLMANTPYISVIHLFISIKKFNKKSIFETIAHEVNHSLFYYYHKKDINNYTLLDNIIIEGLAENFREEVIGGKPAPWSISLSKKEAFQNFEKIKNLLNSKDKKIIQEVLFGYNKYKKWAGYSMGYWIIKEFRENNSNIKWEEIMKKESNFFIKLMKPT